MSTRMRTHSKWANNYGSVVAQPVLWIHTVCVEDLQSAAGVAQGETAHNLWVTQLLFYHAEWRASCAAVHLFGSVSWQRSQKTQITRLPGKSRESINNTVLGLFFNNHRRLQPISSSPQAKGTSCPHAGTIVLKMSVPLCPLNPEIYAAASCCCYRLYFFCCRWTCVSDGWIFLCIVLWCYTADTDVWGKFPPGQ